jgi:hypothetical protein
MKTASNVASPLPVAHPCRSRRIVPRRALSQHPHDAVAARVFRQVALAHDMTFLLLLRRDNLARTSQ